MPTGSSDNNILSPYYTGTEFLLEKHVIPRFAITETNKAVIDLCDFVVSGVCRNFGGAQQAVKYAIRKKKSVISLFDQSKQPIH